MALCLGYLTDEGKLRDVPGCFVKMSEMFNNKRVIEAGRVAQGYDTQLKEILEAEVQSWEKEFLHTTHSDKIYHQRFQAAVDNFIAAASKLPRGPKCIPPCGFQPALSYNCTACHFGPCQLPLDCPVKNISVMETKRTQIRCNVSFSLPDDVEVVWRYAEEVWTQQVDQFEEVTVGTDRLYSIAFTGTQHQGTYQCEIFSGDRSIVRLYYHLTVIPHLMVGQEELQEIFDLSMLPGGRITPVDKSSSKVLPHPTPFTACLTALLLLLFLSLGALYWWSNPEHMHLGDQDSTCPVRRIYVQQ